MSLGCWAESGRARRCGHGIAAPSPGHRSSQAPFPPVCPLSVSQLLLGGGKHVLASAVIVLVPGLAHAGEELTSRTCQEGLVPTGCCPG